MGILEELKEQDYAYVLIENAVKMLADMEKIEVEDAAQWLFMNHAFEQIESFEFTNGRAIASNQYVRDLYYQYQSDVKAILEFIKEHGKGFHNVKKSPKVGLYRWRRDDFWRWVKTKGIKISRSFFTEPFDCPTFLRSKNARESEKENTETHQASNNLVQKLTDAEAKIKQLTAVLQAKEKENSTENIIAGVSITLPHITKTLNALFNVMHTHWTTYDVRHPPKSVVIASDIDHALGWKAQKDGSPSRSAQTLAAAIRPDNLSEADLRNQKRRT
ncbi:Uncharacterized protein MCB1EB_0135 [Mycoavidus cysteinexigens]|uniref:Uncharacterized protein n=1 Tax=Mycoavidus cysteinexigens TaxID=1553431 RepID=A0A2Z6ESB0_9BURK|nr:hypothetical protein [Mycoavidus cysteinexigens]BBE08296.1 Uncharacterized protein MCB1EB_0135 [Mycoavidus cysteinexigens]GLR00802.1 hypothetical protein GCM10007934_06140 [Mycoavidus cysteinexigens]